MNNLKMKIAITILLIAVTARAEWEFLSDYTQPAKDIKNVLVDCPAGEIKFEPSTNDDIYVAVKKIVYLERESKAQKLAKDCKVDFKVSNSTFEVTVDFPRNRYRHRNFLAKLFLGDFDQELEVLIKVSVPKKIGLIVETSSADVFAFDLQNDIAIDGSSSDVSLENIKGDCDLSLSSGDLEAYVVDGNISLDGSSSDFQLSDVIGDLKIATSSGDGIVEEAKGNLELTTSSGDIRIYGLKGDLTCKTSSGDVICDDVDGSVRAKSSSGDIKLRRLKDDKGDFFVKTTSGDVYFEITPIFDGSLEVETISGVINARIDMEINEYSDSYLVGTIGEGPGEIHIITTSGDVKLENF
ncbi:MAG: hypothetical protein B6D58_06785 [candidate division Zixibacteria bacterium 4484_95]|nr:MAG: hypothetical protein B6D58_06785 [candidate division Zixibacteria bacterium 4484_95]